MVVFNREIVINIVGRIVDEKEKAAKELRLELGRNKKRKLVENDEQKKEEHTKATRDVQSPRRILKPRRRKMKEDTVKKKKIEEEIGKQKAASKRKVRMRTLPGRGETPKLKKPATEDKEPKKITPTRQKVRKMRNLFEKEKGEKE